jgi:hypothetical protein
MGRGSAQVVEGRAKTMISSEGIRQAYEVFVDDQGILNLVSLEVVRDPQSNTRLAELIQQDVTRILDEDPSAAYDMIVDLVPLGKAGYASRRARRVYLEISSHRQIRRFAIVGGSVFVRTMARFFIRAAGKGDNMKWFADREEAAKWLEESAGHD